MSANSADTIAAQIKRAERERLLQKRHEWESLFAEWLNNRGKVASGDSQSDEEMQAQWTGGTSWPG